MLACGWFSALGLCAEVAVAAPPGDPPALPERVQLSYSAGPGCPSRAAFEQQIAARIRHSLEWVEESPQRLIRVNLETRGDGASGSLEMVRANDEPTRREFAASTCSEVSSALSLIVALALDPNAQLELRAEKPVPREPVVSKPEVKPPVAPTRADVLSSPVLSERTSPTTARISFGPRLETATGYAPDTLLMLGGTVSVRRVRNGAWSAIEPRLSLSPLWGKTGSTGPVAPNAVFTWVMARLEACPLRFRLAAEISATPCVAAEGGRLTARGNTDEVQVTRTAKRAWAAAGMTLAFELRAGPWFSALGFHALLPFTRDEFVFLDPLRSVHRPGAVVAGGSLALGIELDW